MNILGVSAYYHDSAACLLRDGRILAAAQEERFTRKKHDSDFPLQATRYCLAQGGVGPGELDAVVFYDKPILKFHRILESAFSAAPRGLRQYLMALPLWMREKLWVTPQIEEALAACGAGRPKEIYFTEHHEAHAASAFYPSPFEEAAILTLDGVGEWATATLGIGRGHELELLEELRFPHSLGLLYSAFTYFTGFRVNSGEYKLMGLAPYGQPVYRDKILDELLDLKEDGSFRLNLRYFGFLDSLTMTNRRFAELFGGPARDPEAPITRREMDLAASIQAVTEEIVLRMARRARETTGLRHLCLAGGVALNCVANGKILQSGLFDDLWIQPAAGDAGGAVGAALALWHRGMAQPRTVPPGVGATGTGAGTDSTTTDSMSGAYLGPEFSDRAIAEFLDHYGYPYRRIPDAEWPAEVARLLDEGGVVGLFQGRMEFGPRALGNRSIVADARSPKMQSLVNLKIKFRESFRPFAPACLEERVSDFFELDRPSPYMLLVAPLRRERRVEGVEVDRDLPLIEWVNRPRSDVPAITHVDFSARVQTVSATTNPRFHGLLRAFEERTGYGILINTSFNVRGEPIVGTPEDAYRCFMSTEMDYLALGSFLLTRTEQPHWQDQERWQRDFAPD